MTALRGFDHTFLHHVQKIQPVRCSVPYWGKCLNSTDIMPFFMAWVEIRHNVVSKDLHTLSVSKGGSSQTDTS